ncbi:hypothetical protein CK203_031867 [Vitis vinifera]|uniref:DUF659 domain-containing protein n=1 Tax=Vitis vinifera TaxID=29760 RepID=A0A438INF3_VITVI|nr:hypothetical protein CK203_031867 [Vitis vinifera]
MYGRVNRLKHHLAGTHHDVVANFGPGFKPPSMHELRTWILKEESAGTWFMKSIDAFDTIKNGELMFKYLDEVVEEIGEENVVQVITDNASNYVNVGMRLMEKRSRLWWTPCAAHCIDLMLEDIGKLNVHRKDQPWVYIYELMDSAKEKMHLIVRAWRENMAQFGEKLMQDGLRNFIDLYNAAGYYLNPQLRILDYQERLKADIQLDSYDQAMGEFGSRIAIDFSNIKKSYKLGGCVLGFTSELQKFAIRVLSLTCSASGCERNWSTFESIHTKKRNRLEHQRLNALVYVRYNTKLRERSLQRKQNVDPILVEEIDSDDEWIAEKRRSPSPLIFVGFKIMNYSMLMPLELCHPTPKRRKHHRIIWFLHIPTKGNIMKYQVSTSGGKGKEKELNLTPIDEDEDLDEMGIHDSGHFPTIDTLDEDDDDLGEEDLS